MPSNLRISIGENWAAHDFAGFMQSLDDLYNAHLLLREVLDKADGRERLTVLPVEIGGLRKAVLSVLPNEMLRVVRVEYASPGLTDFAGIGKVMEEFSKFVIALFDRFSDFPKRRIELKDLEFELSEKKQRAERDAELHEAEIRRRRLENRSKETDVVRKELHLYQELRTHLSKRSNLPGEFDRLMASLLAHESTFAELVQVGKITGVEQIEEEKKGMSNSA